ncbi:MAG TPA: kelch repeat-containing protein [Candidatus Limnocylindrales bacterium]
MLPALGAAFSRGPDLTPRRWWHTATRLLDGRVLVAGGEVVDPGSATAPPTLARVDVFDPRTNSWVAAAPLHHARQLHTATLLADGRVLVLGGSAESAGNRAVPVPGGEVYSPATNTWSVIAEPPASIVGTAVTLQGGLVLYVGDDVARSGTTVAELYDPRTNGWSILPDPPTVPVAGTTTLLQDGRVLFAGGTSPGQELPSGEPTTIVFNPQDRTWRAGQDLPEGLFGHTATVLEDGRVVVTGASSDLSVGVTYLFHPETLSWTFGRTPELARIGGVAALLDDGSVFVAGNGFCDGSESIAELFNVTSGRWVSAGAIPVIDGGTATRLADGRVLLAGGQAPCSDSAVPGNVFLFDPSQLP